MKERIQELLKKFWPFLLIIVFSYWALRPLFEQGFFTMHDDQQIARLFALHEAITAGQFPVRWVDHLGFGFGYPLFVFYPPLVYYFGLLFHVLGFSLIVSTKTVMGLGFLLSGLFMYLWVKKHHGKIAGVTSALVYIYAPYHIVDLYVRGAFSEFFSFVWIPAIFWAWDNFAENKTHGWLVLSSVFLSLLVITHNLIALPFLPFFAIYALYLLIRERKSLKEVLLKFAVSGVLALGLSAFFWIPSLFEKTYTLVDAILTRELASYTIHFLDPVQLWQTPWGYGGSGQGVSDGMSLKVGKVHILGSVLSVFALLTAFILKRKKTPQSAHTLLVCLLLLLALFMTVPLSKFLWDTIDQLAYLQFPWRFLVFATVFTSFLCGAFIGYLKQLQVRYVPVVGMICLAGGAIYLLRPYITPQTYLRVDDSFYTKNQDIEWRISKTSFEYMNKDTATTISPLNTTVIDIAKDEIPSASYKVLSPGLIVQESMNKPHHKQYTTKGVGILQVHVNNFPGWTVYIDGKESSFVPLGKFQVMTIQVPDGDHRVDVQFENTQVRKSANSITVISLIAAALLLFMRKREKNGPKGK